MIQKWQYQNKVISLINIITVHCSSLWMLSFHWNHEIVDIILYYRLPMHKCAYHALKRRYKHFLFFCLLSASYPFWLGFKFSKTIKFAHVAMNFVRRKLSNHITKITNLTIRWTFSEYIFESFHQIR